MVVARSAQDGRKADMAAQVILRSGRERSLLQGHPWVFSGSVDSVQGDPEPGATVELMGSEGQSLGRAAYSPASQIRCRAWTFVATEAVDRSFFRQRLTAAIEYRSRLALWNDGNTALRLVNAESDGLPGVVIDRYNDVLVGQFLTCGADAWKQTVADLAMELTGCRSFYERSDTSAREREGIEPACGLLGGEEPPPRVTIREGGLPYLVDVRQGHKTGFYLDQRENRRLLAAASAGRDVLNAFCYSGAFGIAALAAGAQSVMQVDTSAEALELARANAGLNGFSEPRCQCVRADVFEELRRLRDRRASFDVVVLDPPKFADTRSQLDRACRGYKDIALLALKLLRPGGELFTFSCSGAMTPELFQKIVAAAAADAGREAVVLRELSQAPDHPRLLRVPETCYLKGLQVTVRGDCCAGGTGALRTPPA
jgi:23S rRNA (cytosine1962-C5)-methyltransferase